jgi:uncharacterized protein YbjT (DUF2867 family)
MKVDAEDFRRVYESMNDDALLAVKREDLVPMAQQCYDVEVARRGLAGEEVEEAAAAASEPAGEGEEMVELATFTDVDDARLARELLKSAEIPCYLQNDDPLAGNWIGGAGQGAFRLSVPAEWLEQAREILETEISDEELAAQAEAAAELEEEEAAELDERE